MTTTPAQVGLELGVTAPSPLQLEQWGLWIGQAYFLIGNRFPIHELDPLACDYVALKAVVEHARHPSAEVQKSVSVDDAAVSSTYRRAEGRVVISPELWAILDPSMEDSSAFSVTPSFSPYGVLP